MKLTRRTGLPVLALLLALVASSAFANTAIKPEPRDPNWVKRHEGFVAIAKQGGVNVLFVGDSITDAWRRADEKGGKKVWDAHFAPLGAANFGISGDRTQHVLWRLENGELDGIKPKAVVMMIGTNNTGFERDGTTPRNTPAETVEGVAAILKKLRTSQPQAKILLLAVFPRGESPNHPQRLQVNEINAGIAKLADGKSIRFLDIGQKFLAADGTLPKEIMPDFLHPGEKGYEIWAAAIKEPLAAMLK
ncbi:platelet-activating factor acetylhydrolase IB subunit [Horticoccus sp. 23ND18S-11]|uniref:platelet-activating factor acetylhydrolase IB subunit n=1 Tax=Horticoccus sp. 23ND18S-11 TaxID=3391832 RepID=UPI0039C919D1